VHCAGGPLFEQLIAVHESALRVDLLQCRCLDNGIFWVLRSGAPWRDLPDSFGPYTTCYNRFVRWRRAGVWGKIMNALARAHDAAVQMIDTSIVVRAFQPILKRPARQPS
jgi:transposase